ncbi:MAG: hypothetical protein NZ580_06420 [Bacteroidia bacterium]|nr:hypothetical protein [Bacteroidia bacterium]MDW8235418.1 hypothetical protein [Bacteroidia bacterium]
MLLWAKLVLQIHTWLLPCESSLFAVDAVHNVYLWCPQEKALYKLWAPTYDSVSRIGGAPGSEGFLGVTSLVPTGNQQLYVLDAEGQKLYLLGTNLQPLQEVPYENLPPEVAGSYPWLMTVGSGGALYLLLRESQEIVKIDPFGRVLMTFGGKTYGDGAIVAGTALHAENEKIYAADTLRRCILIYDNWGNFLEALPFPEEAQQGIVSAHYPIFWGRQKIWVGEKEIEIPFTPSQVWLQGERLYWMSGQQMGWLLRP